MKIIQINIILLIFIVKSMMGSGLFDNCNRSIDELKQDSANYFCPILSSNDSIIIDTIYVDSTYIDSMYKKIIDGVSFNIRKHGCIIADSTYFILINGNMYGQEGKSTKIRMCRNTFNDLYSFHIICNRNIQFDSMAIQLRAILKFEFRKIYQDSIIKNNDYLFIHKDPLVSINNYSTCSIKGKYFNDISKFINLSGRKIRKKSVIAIKLVRYGRRLNLFL